ncbi:esterase FrsA [Pantoea sp. Mb-10]|uniref:esterase FrsA n=1 Tax=unclassified Pantoea TaxID=2630326 RepID=UPI001E58170B|nr:MULTISPECIES: esterase FrsA [unclassified Pantoea]MCE0489016.1 esterase FrsA [Pantoea sp. Mb-10]MCE0503628.1 esterase FrsA [Pantoea sp. Pb-8]
MSTKNLSEELFKPRFKHPETSTLVRRQHHHPIQVHSALEGDTQRGWYRMLNKLLWTWRGVSPLELSDVLARIAVSNAERTDDRLLDTVMGYRGGNWNYEWSKQGARWQQQAMDAAQSDEAGHHWLQASLLYSLAAYPFIKGDALADQAQLLANRAYEEATQRLPGELKSLTFSIPGGSPVTAFLHMPPQVSPPYPTVLLCGGLDALQSDHYRLFHDYLAPRGIAMLTLDMPSVGFSSKWTLNQDTSQLHQHVLRELPNVAWIDHTRVALLGYRFGANIATRLAYLEVPRLRAVATLGAMVHSVFVDTARQQQLPDMYLDMLASRLGMPSTSDSNLRIELNRYSLKIQGLLGRRTPVPLLAAYWPGDIFSPEDESRLIASSSAHGKTLLIPAQPVFAPFNQALNQLCDWLAKQLRV